MLFIGNINLIHIDTLCYWFYCKPSNSLLRDKRGNILACRQMSW